MSGALWVNSTVISIISREEKTSIYTPYIYIYYLSVEAALRRRGVEQESEFGIPAAFLDDNLAAATTGK